MSHGYVFVMDIVILRLELGLNSQLKDWRSLGLKQLLFSLQGKSLTIRSWRLLFVLGFFSLKIKEKCMQFPF